MRVAFVLKKFPVISETFILNQITDLIDKGHEVAIFSLTKGDFSRVHADFIQYNLEKRTSYLLDGRTSAPGRLSFFLRLLQRRWFVRSIFSLVYRKLSS